MDKELEKVIEENFIGLSPRALRVILDKKKMDLNYSTGWGSGQIKQVRDEIEVLEKMLRR